MTWKSRPSGPGQRQSAQPGKHVLESWNNGIMEQWVLKQKAILQHSHLQAFGCCFFPIFHYSNIPIFRFVRATNFNPSGCIKAGPCGGRIFIVSFSLKRRKCDIQQDRRIFDSRPAGKRRPDGAHQCADASFGLRDHDRE